MSTPLNFNINEPPLRDSDFTSMVWKRWLMDLNKKLNGSVTIFWTQLDFTGSNLTSIATRNHADLKNLDTANYAHLTIANRTSLTGGSNSALHFHATDRARANHTGTQLAATISDFSSVAQALIDASLVTAKERIEYNAPIAGFTYTIADITNVMVFKPAGVLATGTVTMPATPVNDQVVRIASTQVITALTHSPNAGQTLQGALTTIAADGFGSWSYRAADTTWYRVG